jgi:hypothetical protein
MDIPKRKLLINVNLLKGVFWLILIGIASQAIVPTYSKQFMKLIETNDVVKHLVILWSIYFLIDFSDDKDNHPLETFKQTAMIWIGYLVVSKQPLYFNIFNFLVITVIYVVNNYSDYLRKNKNKESKDTENKNTENNEQIHNLYKVSNSLSIVLVISCVMGLYSLYNKEKDYKKSKFQNVKFILGSKI